MILTLDVVDPEARRPSRRARLRATGGAYRTQPRKHDCAGRPARVGPARRDPLLGRRVLHRGSQYQRRVSRLTPEQADEREPRAAEVRQRHPYRSVRDSRHHRVGAAEWQRPSQAPRPRGTGATGSPHGGGLLPDDGFGSTDTPARHEGLIGSFGLPGGSDAPAKPSLIPPDWFREHVDPPLPPLPPPPPVAPRPTPDLPGPVAPPKVRDTADDVLAAVLAGAGLDRADLTPELAENLGRILRVVVSGVMDVLDARQRTKEEFRLGVT